MSAQRAAIGAVLCALVAVAFAGVVDCQFLAFDDDLYVTRNPLVTGGLSARAVLAAFTSFHAGNWHPLTWLSHMLDVSLFGVTPAWHHATSALLHAANAVLAFAALAELTRTRWRAALAAALFAVHPLRVESVAWVAERKDVLSACFGLAALWAWARFARTGRRSSYFAALASFAASLLSKPMLVTFPFLLLLLDAWPLARLESWRSLWPRAREKWPFFALAAASCLVTLVAQSRAVTPLPLWLRLENATVAYAEYLFRTVDPSELGAIYPYRPALQPRIVVASAVLVVAISALSVAQRRRRPWLLVGWLWFAGMLVPTLGLVQVGVQAFADRYTYLPSLGLALAASFALGEFAARARFGRQLAAAIAALVLAALVWQTRAQVATWRDTVSVFTRAIEVTRSNWFAHTELGIALAERKEFGPARAELEAALKIRPDCARALANLGLVQGELGAPNHEIELLERALAIEPELAGARLYYGVALEHAGRFGDAEAQYRLALGDERGEREARLRLARLLSVSPDDALRDGAQALALCDEACRESPCDSPEELDTCAMASMEAGRADDAVAKAARAAALARARGDSALAAKIEGRLQSYLRGEPLRVRANGL
ncbi:MAG: tetratricopeptide repeat protein [Myxococcota bacterium]